MIWSLLRTGLLLVAGALAGFAGAAALLRGWLPSRGDATSDELALVTIFDGVELASNADGFHGGSVLAWFGGVALDLTGATLAPGARLDVRVAFGGVSIKVPAAWRIDSQAKAVFGGIDVQRPESDDPNAPALVVRVTSVMGGVAVKR